MLNRFVVSFFAFCLIALPVCAESQRWEHLIQAGDQARLQGKYAEAETNYWSAIERADRFGEKDARLLKSLAKLADLYDFQGKIKEAEPLYKRALLVSEILREIEDTKPLDDLRASQVDMGPFLADVQRRIRRAWVSPAVKEYKKEAGVTFSIHTDGTLHDLQLKKSSGNKLRDEAILDAIEKAAPYRKLFDSVESVTIFVSFPVKPDERLCRVSLLRAKSRP